MARHVYEKGEKNGYRIEVTQDEYAESPQDWNNDIQIMIDMRNRHIAAEFCDRVERPKDDGTVEIKYVVTQYKSFEEVDEAVERGELFSRSLYGYEHSGFAISAAPFGCRWDSGVAGRIVAREEKHIHDSKQIDAYIEAWNQWFSGDVWQFDVIDANGEIVDSGCGFYGDPAEALRGGIARVEELPLSEPEAVVEKRRADTMLTLLDSIREDLVEIVTQTAGDRDLASVRVLAEGVLGKLNSFEIDRIEAASKALSPSRVEVK
jgi:hypothetical protein